MKVYKVVLCVVDNENRGEEFLRNYIGGYPPLMPSVASIESAEIVDWGDDHPLNKITLWRDEFNRLFPSAS